MNEKVESGLEVVAEAYSHHSRDSMQVTVTNIRQIGRLRDGDKLVRQSDAERALQLKHEANRKTWRQLEQVTGLLREVSVLLANSSYKISGTAAFLHSIDAVLSQQAEPAEPAPAQDEQQPVARVAGNEIERYLRWEDGVAAFDLEIGAKLYAAPIAQTAPQGKFRMGDLVKKTSGSEWEGHICGTYSTELTPEGYAVESSTHRGSVQIYPAKALELVPSHE